MTPAIHVDHLNKTFAKKSALVDLELTVSNGGSVKVLGREVQASGRLNGKVRRLRADIGYIFQQFNLVNRLSVLDNVLLGCLGRMPRWRGNLGLFNTEEKQFAMESLARVGLADLASQQSARKVMEILADINGRDGKTVVVTLHQVDYAMRYCPRAVALKGGRIHFDGQASELSSQFLNDLYGADVDTSLMFSDQTRTPVVPARLALARA
eukprot:gene16891-20270_t